MKQSEVGIEVSQSGEDTIAENFFLIIDEAFNFTNTASLSFTCNSGCFIAVAFSQSISVWAIGNDGHIVMLLLSLQ